MSMPPPSSVTALILAGGRAARMDGADKGLLDCAGRPLVEHVLERIAPCVDRILISANRNLDAYRRYGHPVLVDASNTFPGPLAGVERGLHRCATDWLWILPCDAPRADCELLDRLWRTAHERNAPAAVPVTAGHWQPTFALLRCAVHDALSNFLAHGNRAAHAWLRSLPAVEVQCDDHPEWFLNINTPDELAAFATEVARQIRSTS